MHVPQRDKIPTNHRGRPFGGKIGTSSITYRVGLFLEEDPEPAASGHFVHVYVDHETRRPIRVPEIIREALSPILINT